MKLKRILSLFLSCLLIVSSMGTVAFADASVAKVGNTEYATIDEDIVYHEDECLGAYEIKSENGSKYVEVSSGDFSAFTADANVAEVDTLSELQAALLDDETNEIIITEMIVIPEVETVTIDLNGHNISAVVNNNGKHIYALTNKGTLTIKDSGTDGKIVSRGIYNYGKLTLESGAIEACDVEGGYAVNNETGATFIMNGGAVATTNDDDPTTFETTDATAVDVPTGCSVTLNGGEISCISNWCYAVAVSGGNLEVPENSTVSVSGVHGAVSTGSGTTTISGGEFVCVGAGGVSSDHVLYTNGGKLTVNGGTFTNYNTDAGSNGAAVCAKGDAATVEINNGTFVGCEAAVYGNSNTVVNGGSYSLHWDDTYNTEDNLAQYVAVGATVTVDGEKKTKTESGLEVAPAHVAKIGNNTYTTLADALEAASDGDTIELLTDIESSAVFEIGKSLTINGNNHKVISCASRIFRLTTSDIKVTFNNVNMDSTAVRVGTNDVRGISIDLETRDIVLNLNKCNVIFSDTTANDWAYAVNITGGENHTINIDGGSYNGANVINIRGINTVVNVKNATLTSLYPDNDVYYGACIYVVQGNGTKVTASGNTFNGSNAVAFNVGSDPAPTTNNNIDNTICAAVPKVITVSTTDELIAFAKDVNENGNTYAGKYVVLANDIDLAGSETNLWTPIGASGDSDPKFKGTFDGQGNTIKNLFVKQGAAYHAAGLFGATNGTIKNLTIDGAYVESLSSGSATVNGTAVVAGSTAYGAAIDNVHVKNATVKGNRYVAGIVGYMDGTVTNCSIENVTLIATPDDIDGDGKYDNGDKVGGIVGYTNSNATEISGCELKGEVNITGYRDMGGLVGTVQSVVVVGENVNNAKVTITVDQVTYFYEKKAANANEFIGRGTASATSPENTRGQDATFETVIVESFVAELNGVGYASVAEALEAAKDAGLTDVTITLIGETTADTKDSFDLVYETAFDNVTIKQEDSSKVYYIYDLCTGSRTNGGAFIFDGVNIVVTNQYMFEGNVKLTNNSVIKSVAEDNCFHYYCTTIVEPGSKLQGVIDELRGGTLIIDGGRNDGGYNTEADMQDSIMGISWSGDSLTVKNGAYLKVNAANEIGRITVCAETSLNVDASKVDAVEYITVIGAVNTDVNSLITTPKITGTGVIKIDATDFDGSDVQVITADMSGFKGTVEITGNDNAKYEITETGLVITSVYGVLNTKTGFLRNLIGNFNDENKTEGYRVFLFAGIDSLNYANVGYEVKFDGMEKSETSKIVYASCKVNDKIYYPTSFGDDCKYIIAQGVIFGKSHAAKSFEYRVFATKHDGQKLYTEWKTVDGIYTLQTN